MVFIMPPEGLLNSLLFFYISAWELYHINETVYGSAEAAAYFCLYFLDFFLFHNNSEFTHKHINYNDIEIALLLYMVFFPYHVFFSCDFSCLSIY